LQTDTLQLQSTIHRCYRLTHHSLPSRTFTFQISDAQKFSFAVTPVSFFSPRTSVLLK